MVKSLTKENFWNELFQKYPGEMEVFCQWIDSYKKSVAWEHLLGSSIKYHDLPIAFQIGIFIQFTLEVQHHETFLNDQCIESMDQLIAQIKDFFAEEDRITKQEQADYLEDEDDGILEFDEDPFNQV